jgi:hypothetical protein
MLPVPTRTLLWHKARGCLWAAIPGAICVAIIDVPWATQWTHLGAGNHWVLAVAQTVGTWCEAIFLWCLIVFLSLHMKRGALPLSYVIQFVASALLSFALMIPMFLLPGSPPAWLMMAAMAILQLLVLPIVALVLIRKMPPKLEALAGEG